MRGSDDSRVPVFVKASCRSAKDAPAAKQSMVDHFFRKLAEKPVDTPDARMESVRLAASSAPAAAAITFAQTTIHGY